ncbi:hypothetical protein QOZ80_2AG0144010 [Eleusine coracana subsp. coracana]|nr:hypothetical protein QOZ80_2AG0144010 [Eleusine coracana subsp. coracana]
MGRKAKRAMEQSAGKRPAEGSVNNAEEDYAAGAGTGLPMANLVRLIRQVIPTNVKISAHAKQLTHDCAVEFVGFVGGEAVECAVEQHRRTITPEDFTLAFQRLGFDDYVEPMSTYIRRYRENAPRPHAAASGLGFTDEEIEFLMSVIPELHDGAASSEEEEEEEEAPAAA